jgi:hypothetical protein
MKSKLMLVLLAVALTLLASVVTVLLRPAATGASNGDSGYIRRYVAQYMTGKERATVVPPAPNATGGVPVYDVDFFTANDINTLYVTVEGVGDEHGGARLDLACLLDGNPCNNTTIDPVAGAPSGWVTVMRHKNYNRNYAPGFSPDFTGDTAEGVFVGDGGGGAGDLHDNNAIYTWCTPINGSGTHHVQVRLASQNVDASPSPVVFIEAAHFFVDGSRIADEANRCTAVDPPADNQTEAALTAPNSPH